MGRPRLPGAPPEVHRQGNGGKQLFPHAAWWLRTRTRMPLTSPHLTRSPQVNNAGTNVRKSILDATMEEFHAITRVNQVEKI
jgi:hypothetical protein